MFTCMTARVSTNTYCIARTRAIGVSVDGLKTPLDALLANARRIPIPYSTTS